MLKLTPVHGFFAFKVYTHSRPIVGADHHQPWRRGLRLVGATRRGRPLSDGTKDDSYAGCEWIQEWDSRPGYRLFSTPDAFEVVFLTKNVEAVFVGEPTMFEDSRVLPRQVAIPVAAIHPSFDSKKHSSEEFKLASPAQVFDAMQSSTGEVGIRFANLEQGLCSVAPQTPQSREFWKALGFHIPTKSDTASVYGVVPFGISQSFSLPIAYVEDAVSYGVEIDVTAALATEDAAGEIRLAPSSFCVTDPIKAASILPILGKVVKQARVGLYYSHWISDEPDTCAMSHNDAMRLIGAISRSNAGYDTIKIGVHSDNPHILVALEDVKFPPNVQAKVVLQGKPALFVTQETAEALYISARKAAARYTIPKEAVSYVLFIKGVRAEGKFYLRTDLQPRESRASVRAVRAAREKRLHAQYGEDVPTNWKALSDEEVEKVVIWKRRKKEGWVKLEDLCATLGVARTLAQPWATKLGIPAVMAPDHEALYRPTSFKQILTHENFGQVCEIIFGENKEFIRRCILDEDARAAVLAHAIQS